MNEKITSKKTGFRWVVLVLIFCIYMVAGADRSNIGMVVPYLKESFHMTNTDIGAMASFFYVAYAVVQIPSGHLYGKRGVKKIFSLSIILTSVATLIMGLADSAVHLKAARALLGFSEGPINIGCLTTINKWFPTQEKGIATGVFMAAIKFAPAFVPPVCAWIIMVYGWREVFYIFAVPGILFAVLWWIFVKNDPSESSFVNQAELDYINDSAGMTAIGKNKEAAAAVRDGLIDKLIRTQVMVPLATNKEVLRSWNVWACALGYFFLVGITYTIMTWIPTYLVYVKHFSIIKVGLVAAAPWVGAVLGNLLGGFFSDKIFKSRRKPNMLITAISTVFLMYSLLYAPSDPTALGVVLLLAGIFLNFGYSMFLAYPMGITTKEKCPFAAAIVNTAGSLGGAFAPFAVGVILDAFSWDSVFIFLAAISLITFILVITMVEPITKAAVFETNQ
ncbi:DgoT [Megasphaera cerevisiae DSM 20462]|jgi:sugar phosphate permease|uniref:DgoT n=1 Tax=Megasphaera cerevisiae DSM 20462 TaxID=1122219 RepID=A0A0J6WZL2_9FIRM|nr:MFS transporter [Megasphaera cerevisiae]KMO87698.1 DgoT [Megasphaera cerevisiae DSM 20462]OKY53448.1 MFS transporter [Megasphaera cerevisiae]SJZ75708.1 Sugar phosphate permease [Megasphaera cerevisiae DSM 20462]